MNAVGLQSRTGDECRRKFNVLRSNVKAKVATSRKETGKTGGGPSGAACLTPLEEGAASMLSVEQTEGIQGGVVHLLFYRSPVWLSPPSL